jgi:HK97 gp10 family phage protein
VALDLSEMTNITSGLERIRLQMKEQGRKKAVRAGAKVIQKAMIENAPIIKPGTAGSSSLAPGALKSDIRIASIDDDGDPGALIGPGTKTEHVARWVEYGHRMVSGGQSHILADGKAHGPGKAAEKDVPGYPFLRPAFEGSEAAALDAVSVTLEEELEKAAS